MERYSPYSELKIFHHTDRVAGLLRGKRVPPIYVRIKPTNVCNQNCYYCVYANDLIFDGRQVDRRESIPWELLERTLRELAGMGVKAVTFSGGGEPLCYHSIVEVLRLTQGLGMDYSMITNGQALEGEAAEILRRAKWVRVSFDACREETYEGVRKVPTHRRVVGNIEDFARKRSAGCTLGINCVVSEQNAAEVYGICELVKGLGVDNIKLSPMAVKEGQGDYHGRIMGQVKEQISRAKQRLEDGRFRIVDKYSDDLAIDNAYRKTYHACHIQELFAVIAADSKVYRCHQRAYMEDGEIGDLAERTFKEIWHSEETIENVRRFDPHERCPFRCAFDERNMLLDDFLHMDRNHVNFI